MFGFLDRLRGIEPRSSTIDIGALYQSVFAFGGGGYSFAQSPAILASSLSVLDNAGALLTEIPTPWAARRPLLDQPTAPSSSPEC